MEQVGVKETKEAMIALMALGLCVAGLAKDGVSMADAAALAAKMQGDAEFAAKLKAGYEGLDQVPAEIKDMKLGEGLELAAAVIPELVKMLSK